MSKSLANNLIHILQNRKQNTFLGTRRSRVASCFFNYRRRRGRYETVFELLVCYEEAELEVCMADIPISFFVFTVWRVHSHPSFLWECNQDCRKSSGAKAKRGTLQITWLNIWSPSVVCSPTKRKKKLTVGVTSTLETESVELAKSNLKEWFVITNFQSIWKTLLCR